MESSLNNFLPPNRENIGYKVFPLPNKSIRLDDPNYIHYVPTEPIFGDRFDAKRKDSDASYTSPMVDDRTILRTHVSVSSYRRSYSGSLTPSSPSPQKILASPNQKNTSQDFSPLASPQPKNNTQSDFSPLASPNQNPVPPIESPNTNVINLRIDNLIEENFHILRNSIDDEKFMEKRENSLEANEGQDEKLEVSVDEKKENPQKPEDHYATVTPKEERPPKSDQIYDEPEYDMAVGPTPPAPVVQNTDETATVTPPSTISDDDQPVFHQAPTTASMINNAGSLTSTISDEEQIIKRPPTATTPLGSSTLLGNNRGSLPPGYFEELQKVTSEIGAMMQMKEAQQEAITRKELELEVEKQKVKIDYKAEKFLDEVPKTDMDGLELADSKRLSLAQQLAEKRYAEKEAELLAEFEEWKRVNNLELPWALRNNSPPLPK